METYYEKEERAVKREKGRKSDVHKEKGAAGREARETTEKGGSLPLKIQEKKNQPTSRESITREWFGGILFPEKICHPPSPERGKTFSFPEKSEGRLLHRKRTERKGRFP